MRNSRIIKGFQYLILKILKLKKREREYQETIKKVNADIEKIRVEKNDLVRKMHQERAKVKALEKQRMLDEGSVKSRKGMVQKSDTEDQDNSDDHSGIFHKTQGKEGSRPGSRPQSRPQSRPPSRSRLRPDSRTPVEASRPISGRPISGMSKTYKIPTGDEDELYEYQALNLKQAAKIKELKVKKDELKAKVQQQDDVIKKEVEKIQVRLMHKIKTLEQELDVTKNELGYLQKENKSLKHLSHIIIEQRNEAEVFLIDAINYAKTQIKKNEGASTKTDFRRTKFPEIDLSRPTTTGKLTTGKVERMDMGETNWEEKEKILRVLFAKLNASQIQKMRQSVKEMNELLADKENNQA